MEKRGGKGKVGGKGAAGPISSSSLIGLEEEENGQK